MCQDKFGKIDEYVWWDLEIISSNVGMQFTSTYFQEECQTHRVQLMFAAPEHQEMNRQVELTCRMLRTIAHSLRVHARVSEACIHFVLMYMTDHIFTVLPIKYMVNEDS